MAVILKTTSTTVLTRVLSQYCLNLFFADAGFESL